MPKEKMKMFTGDMVRAILDGSKTQTRRPVKINRPAGTYEVYKTEIVYTGCGGTAFKRITPSLQPGDTMLVRERARLTNFTLDCRYQFTYEADGAKSEFIEIPDRIKEIGMGHCVPNGCFKELVRIKRKVVRVWYERIRDIDELGALAEGVQCEKIISGKLNGVQGDYADGMARDGFKNLWESIYPGSWDRNEWCECIEFKGAK